MLTISNNAAALIQKLLARPGVTKESGVRIQETPDRLLSFMVVKAPRPGDASYSVGNDARLYVAEEATDRVHDKVFDARRNDAGRMQFVLAGTPR